MVIKTLKLCISTQPTWHKNRISFVKLAETSLIISAIPFLLSAIFLRSLFQTENTEWTILWIVSRFRADLLERRLILSCWRLTSRPQCMLSMDQCVRTIAPSRGVSAAGSGWTFPGS